MSANETIVMGVIGCGGRGQHLLAGFQRWPGCEIGAVCDVDELRRGQAQAQAGERAKAYSDFRELLEQDDIDAIIVATPDHWHAIPTITACEAGKDVYVEKPLAHNIVEGQAMVEAARKYDRIIQHGTQQRGGEHYMNAVEMVRSGVLGKISRCEVWNFWNQSGEGTGGGRDAGIGSPADCDPPPGVDYDLWLGPAPKRPFNPNRFHFNYIYFWDYAGGMMTGWEIHNIDVVHWAMGVDTPLSASSCGGKYVLEDNRDTPDTLDTLFQYPGFTVQARVYHANARPLQGRGYGVAFYGSSGSLVIDRGGFEVYPEAERIPVKTSGGSPQDEPHQQHFLECIRTRKRSFADVEIAHRSTIPCHLANISYRTGRKIRWDAQKEQIIGDEEASNFLKRDYREPWHI